MRKNFSIFLRLFFALILATWMPFAFASSKVNILPRFDLSTYKGKWVIINYWAGWCGACQEEVDQLNRFYETHKNHVVLLGVNYDQLKGAQLTQAIYDMGIHFPILAVDPQAQLGVNVIEVLPTSIFIGPEGKIRTTLYGSQTAQSLEANLR